MSNKNNIYIKDKEKIKLIKPTLQQNTSQLTDKKKKKNGFDISDSVIDVEQCGYGVSHEDDILFTYGIEPCCGLVLYDGNVRVLFHLDGSIVPENVTKITNNLGLRADTTALFAPGLFCDMSVSFDYKKLEEEYRKLGYKILEHRIPASFGFVTVGKNQITVGTALNRDLDKTFPIERKKSKVETQKLGREVLPELEDVAFLQSLKEAMLRQNEMIIKKNERNQ